MTSLRTGTALAIALATGLAFGTTAAQAGGAHEGEQLYPVLTYRTGPYAPSGIPFLGGLHAYIRYVNEVEGGVNGVKIYTPECETAYSIERGIECYERFKHGYEGAPTAIFQPHSSGLDAALLDKARQDHVPVFGPGGGQAIAFEGRVFPYSFPLVFDYWSEASIVVQYIADRAGGYDKLKGVKLATLYHDSGYGRDTIEPLAILAKKYGFEDIQIPVPHPGEQQQTQWQQIKQANADWVFLRGWGVMNPVAIKTAARVGFPVDHIIGDIWSGSEEDVRPAGAVAKGYLAITPFPAGSNFEIHQKLKKYILDKGLSDLKDPKSFGSVYYNSGVDEAIIAVEAIRTAQAHFGVHPINGEEAQWGLEHLDLSEKRIAELGATGLEQPLKLSVKDHEGGGAGKVLQWDGEKWNVVSDGWVKSDRDLLLPLIYERAEAYAKEKGIALRDATN